MDHVNLVELAVEHVEAARRSSSGRSAHTVRGGRDHALRQTVLALATGTSLGEHDSPGEATLQVLAGRVELRAGDETWAGSAGDHVSIPPVRHDLTAVEDAAVLLTVVAGR